MAQDYSGKKKSVSPDLLKLMMNEDDADQSAFAQENPSRQEQEAATRIVDIESSESENRQHGSQAQNSAEQNSAEQNYPDQNQVGDLHTEERHMVTNPRGPIKRGSDFAVAEPTIPVHRSSPQYPNPQAVTQARASSPPKRAGEMTPLLQSEHMRIAQTRIKELEEVVETLRVDNEQLSSASETLKHRNDELTSKLENLESRIQDVTENATREKSFLDTSLKSKTREVSTLRLKVEELESRLHQDLRKIRVRERELENIIEIVRAEHAAVILNKDEMILSLKRKVDDLMHQMETQNQRLKEQDRASREEHEKVKRTVKGLRAALIMLEGDDQAPSHLKKVE